MWLTVNMAMHKVATINLVDDLHLSNKGGLEVILLPGKSFAMVVFIVYHFRQSDHSSE